ncbi:hypothetical protein OPV22_019364 [Ensete ventricosum]|uniref:DUF7903 domain-containing protein n=1 Tax=Ensete ventricosum TaxID=4639 RepID=A0AAV8QIY8_ENSVE|nr:hypothetical protein OPV22_019364 [Ensete ventricosum]
MAYIPPHKRHSGAANKPTPLPPSLSRHFDQSLTLSGSSAHRRTGRTDSNHGRGQIVYAARSISRWWTIGGHLNHAGLRLEPYPCEIVERKSGSKPLVLAVGGDPLPVPSGEDPPPWVEIAKRIEPDLLSAATSARGELASENEDIKLSFVSRVGKVFFHGESSSCLDSLKKAAIAEADIRGQVHKSFHTNIPNEHLEELQRLDLVKLEFDFDSEKEQYHVKVVDKSRPGSTISCKCTVVEGGGLEIRKIELNQVRHLVVDISCLPKDLDVRLMLYTKRILETLNDEEEKGINRLISDAVIDQDVKGGLRWPLGKEVIDEKFNIVGVWHTKYKVYRSQNIRLKFRFADRFDHRTSVGEVSNELSLKLTGISEQLIEEGMETSSLSTMVQDAVKLIWVNFLSYNHSS